MGARTALRRSRALALRRARSCSRNGEQGAALLETALSTLILLVFIFAVMEGAMAVYAYHFISEAAREGARYAIVRGSTAGPDCGASITSAYCDASGPNITSYVKSLNFPGIDPGNMTVNPAWAAYVNASSCPASPSPCNSPGNKVTVQVQYNFPLSLPFVSTTTISMSSTAAMIISQ